MILLIDRYFCIYRSLILVSREDGVCVSHEDSVWLSHEDSKRVLCDDSVWLSHGECVWVSHLRILFLFTNHECNFRIINLFS